MKAYKLMRQLKDGKVYPLFINKTEPIEFGVWLEAHCYPTEGFKVRTGWHACWKPCAPHLKQNLSNGEKRVWVECLVKTWETYERPESQGGQWVLAKWIKPLRIIDNSEINDICYKVDHEQDNEIWKIIPDFPRYSASTLGRIKHNANGRIRHLHKNSKGYWTITFTKDKQHFTLGVHQVIAKTFIPNPNNLPQINHKDEDQLNNRVDNLEWCTGKYNANYGGFQQRKSVQMSGERNPFYGKHHSTETIDKLKHRTKEQKFTRKVKQIDPNTGEVIKIWDSIVEYPKSIGDNRDKGIGMCCRHLRKQAYGYQWEYEGERMTKHNKVG